LAQLYLSALALGVVAGLRTFTAPAAVFLARGGVAGIVLAFVALGELIADKLPTMPSRTSPPALTARIVSGGFVGWYFLSSSDGRPAILGAGVGVVGALIGAFGGVRVRRFAIDRIGAIPAALCEDAIAIGIAAFVVTR
jgi:uncharacterized membrane protein